MPISNLQFAFCNSQSKNAAPERRFCQVGTRSPCLEFKQGIAGDGQLVPPVLELAESFVAGEVSANFRANLNLLVWVVIEADSETSS